MKNLIDCFNFVSKPEPDSQNYSKSSFYRFGDDLTELVLSYLPFGDRISLECVCYQFSQLVYSNQKELTLNERSNHYRINDLFFYKIGESLPNLRRLDLWDTNIGIVTPWYLIDLVHLCEL